MHLICTCNATYTVKEAVSTLYSHVYTVHAHYMYAVNTCIAQLKTYSEIQSLQDYHERKLITIHDDSIDELEIPEGNLEDIHLHEYQLKTFLRHERLHYQNGYIYRIPGNNSTTG